MFNQRAFEFASRLGAALHCDVVRSIFARKNYFYPDMPKDYQISQYDQPINVDGWLDLPSGQRVGIERAHIEEDTGKNTHVGRGGRIHEAEYSLIDYNRSGVPLVEIVSAPDLRSAEAARAYVQELRDVLARARGSPTPGWRRARYGSTPTCRSVGRTTRYWARAVRSKNLNSLRSLGRAIDYEARRQIDLIESGGRVVQETRHWDEQGGRTRAGRSKEEAEDYRYFAEPDLVPLEPDESWVASLRESLPALPAARREALAARRRRRADGSGRGASPSPATSTGWRRPRSTSGADPVRVLNHVQHNLAVEGADRLDAGAFARLVAMETEGRLTPTQAKVVLSDARRRRGRPRGDRRGPRVRGDGRR